MYNTGFNAYTSIDNCHVYLSTRTTSRAQLTVPAIPAVVHRCQDRALVHVLCVDNIKCEITQNISYSHRGTSP